MKIETMFKCLLVTLCMINLKKSLERSSELSKLKQIIAKRAMVV